MPSKNLFNFFQNQYFSKQSKVGSKIGLKVLFFRTFVMMATRMGGGSSFLGFKTDPTNVGSAIGPKSVMILRYRHQKNEFTTLPHF